MRTFLICLAVTGVIVLGVSAAYGIGWMVLVGAALIVIAAVMGAQGSVARPDNGRTRAKSTPRS